MKTGRRSQDKVPIATIISMVVLTFVLDPIGSPFQGGFFFGFSYRCFQGRFPQVSFATATTGIVIAKVASALVAELWLGQMKLVPEGITFEPL